MKNAPEKKPTPGASRVVWSAEQGDLRDKSPARLPATSLPPNQQTITLRRESKGRAGKGVTILQGFLLTETDLETLVKKIKQACGSGGTIKDDVVEIQGEQREKIADLLRKLGYKVKIAGG